MAAHFPLTELVNFTRTPNSGEIPNSFETRIIKSNSRTDSKTRIDRSPSLVDKRLKRTNSESLNPLQIINDFGLRFCDKASKSSAFEPTSNPKSYSLPYLTTLSTTCACWLTFIGKTPKYRPWYSFSLIAF